MKIIEEAFLDSGLNDLFQHNQTSTYVKFGTVVIQPHAKIPETGFSEHEEDEYSIIIEGEIEGESGGEKYKVGAGNATLIPAKEQHWTINNSDQPCRVIYALVGKK